jgi:MYXO-CTERM domain-containing protein
MGARVYRIGTLLFLATLVLAMSVAVIARADDPGTVGARIATSLTGGTSSVASLQMRVDNNAMSLLSLLTTNGSFKDLDYSEPPTAVWGVGTHFSRVLSLATAYQVPGSLYHSATLLTDIENALTFGTGPDYYCGAASCVTGNWWWWQIGVPQQLGPTLILMQGAIDTSTIAALTAKLTYHVGTDAQMFALTGENELWVALGHLYIAVLDDSVTDAPAIQTAVEASAAVNAKAFGDGIKSDESFQFHSGQLYTGGYGSDFASDIMTYLGFTNGTTFAPPPVILAQAVDYIADGVAWCVYDSYFDPGTRGREVTRPIPGIAPLEAFVPAALVSSPLQAELQGYAKQLVNEEGTGGLDIVTQAEQVAALKVTGAFPSGHRHYPDSDYTVHRSSSYFLSIKMLSTRTKSGELVNGEGLQGARQSDGKMFLVRKGTEYLGPSGVGLWPALDWSRLPGITVLQNGNANSTDYGDGTEAFVGGTGDGQNGVSAMILAPIGETLRANKSWFFFQGYAVFLANGITTIEDAPVETIVEQWPLSAATVPIIADGTTVASGAYSGMLPDTQWISADGLGYFFPGRSSVQVTDATQSGNWMDLGVSQGTVTAPFLTLALEHGNAPTNASAAYAIAFDGQDMSTFAASPPFSVVQNDATISAVAGQGAAGAVFWVPGSITINTSATASDTPCVVWLANDGTALTVSVADPAQGTGQLHVTVSGGFKSGSGSDSGITVALTSTGATLTVDRTGGVTHIATLTLLHPSSPDAGPAGTDASAGSDGATVGPASNGGSHGSCGCRVAGEHGSRAIAIAWAVGIFGLFGARRRRLSDARPRSRVAR